MTSSPEPPQNLVDRGSEPFVAVHLIASHDDGVLAGSAVDHVDGVASTFDARRRGDLVVPGAAADRDPRLGLHANVCHHLGHDRVVAGTPGEGGVEFEVSAIGVATYGRHRTEVIVARTAEQSRRDEQRVDDRLDQDKAACQGVGAPPAKKPGAVKFAAEVVWTAEPEYLVAVSEGGEGVGAVGSGNGRGKRRGNPRLPHALITPVEKSLRSRSILRSQNS